MKTIRPIYSGRSIEDCIYNLATDLAEVKRQRPQIHVEIVIKADTQGNFIRAVIKNPRDALIGEICFIPPNNSGQTASEYKIGDISYYDVYRPLALTLAEASEKYWFLHERVKKSTTSWWHPYNKPAT